MLVDAEIQLPDNSLWLMSSPALPETRQEINSSTKKAREGLTSERQHQGNCSDIIMLQYFPFPNTGRI